MKVEFKNGRYVDKNGDICWYKEGLFYRENGPTIERDDGSKEWFLNGIEYTEEQFNQWLAKKELNERLHQTLEEKPSLKKPKI